MKIYLDNCSIQRPLDDRSQLRIAVESEIILNILALIESEKIDLLSSEILVYEANKISNIFRKEFTLKVLSKRTEFAELDDMIENRSKEFTNSGIKPVDALHLASAEKMEADFFCTCDDKFLKKAVKIKDLRIKAVSIFELLKEIEK
ncbi:PIN domain-containing protein [Desulfonema limicola]|uniref:PIN domain-containing protein n=1 Tax=Desulfonema limicola TaxID=45656 RepID=A0A975GI13_9BACT|nr:PIN domain-containing protein [Desulfonema limicola]QTA82062.1 PIN domain-containing protein [Desulfonema limicola]